ncbi:MAG: WG repeat-containing protein [Culturomica sp.]|jgi:hypothetical protein|nr:WG repeat-containing protein [Culturomica sp.]
MKILISILTIIFVFTISLQAQSSDALIRFSLSLDMEPYVMGYKDASGQIVIPTDKYRYCFTEVFDKIAIIGHRAPGSIENKYYAIDRAENILFEVAAGDNSPDEVQNGLFRIIVDGKMGFANMNGDIVIQPAFSTVLPFSEGLAAFCIGGMKVQEKEHSIRRGGKWGFVDTTGQIVIPAQFDRVRSFNDGRTTVEKSGTYYKIDKKGNVIN